MSNKPHTVFLTVLLVTCFVSSASAQEDTGPFYFSKSQNLVALVKNEIIGHELRVYNLDTGLAVTKYRRFDDEIANVKFSTNGDLLLVCTLDKEGDVYDIKTDQQHAVSARYEAGVNTGAFAPDDRSVAFASTDGYVAVWDIKKIERNYSSLPHISGGQLFRVNSVSFSPDGNFILTACSGGAGTNGYARLWKSRDGKITKLVSHKDDVLRARFSLDGNMIATCSKDKTARVWSVSEKDEDAITDPLIHDGVVTDVVFSHDSKRVATASVDGTVKIWNARTGKVQLSSIKHDKPIFSVRFSQDGERIVTAAYDNSVRTWDSLTGKEVGIPVIHDGPVFFASFYAEGKYVASISNGCAIVSDANSGKIIRKIEIGHK